MFPEMQRRPLLLSDALITHIREKQVLNALHNTHRDCLLGLLAHNDVHGGKHEVIKCMDTCTAPTGDLLFIKIGDLHQI